MCIKGSGGTGSPAFFSVINNFHTCLFTGIIKKIPYLGANDNNFYITDYMKLEECSLNICF